MRQDDISEVISVAIQKLMVIVDKHLNNFLRIGIDAAAEATQLVNGRFYKDGLYKKLQINALPREISRSMVNNWTTGNVSLITNANEKQLKSIERLFRSNAYSGIRARDMEAELNKIFKGTRKNIKLIARDQVGKLNGELHRQKQVNAGIPGYYWRGSLDESERATHVDREGKYYSWDAPPPDGHPGQPIQCRCSPEPAIDKVLNA